MRKKKPRKQMRMNRRRMKAEINRLRNNEKRLLAKTIQADYILQPWNIETLRTEKVINIFDAGSNEFAGIIQREMAQEICNALVERGYITFRTQEEPILCGVRLTASINVVRQ